MDKCTHTDLLIIGGGINGTGIAADAAGRGLSVTLCEQDDLANATSSKSTGLIHGGLRYLEHYQFRLVREALKEREVLLKKAPHLIAPLQFILPHTQKFKPLWMMRLGLFLYDHLSSLKTLAASQTIFFKQHAAGNIIRDTYTRGFIYTDCQVDDARLVILNAIAAHEKGAQILTRTRFLSAKRQHHHWEIVLEEVHTGEKQTVTATALINAAGPWVDQVLHEKLQLTSSYHTTLVKGSHIIVPKLYEENVAFILPTADNRVIFVIPYFEKYNLIGTTEIPYQGNPNDARITTSEITYLCACVNDYFTKQISAKDIVSTYAGVRPLCSSEPNKNPSAITRDYTLALNASDHQPPLLSIFGGKITTYRKLAEKALNLLQPFFKHMRQISTENIALPGGDMGHFDIYMENFSNRYPFIPLTLAKRWIKQYGTRVEKLLKNVTSPSDLGHHIGSDLYEKEVAYLMKYEWGETAEDILWRRTKLGISFSEEENKVLQETMARLRASLQSSFAKRD